MRANFNFNWFLFLTSNLYLSVFQPGLYRFRQKFNNVSKVPKLEKGWKPLLYLDLFLNENTFFRDQVCLQLTPGNVVVEKTPEPDKANPNQASVSVPTQQSGNVVAQSQPPTRGLVTYQHAGMPHPVALNPQPSPIVIPPPARPAWAPNTQSSVPPNRLVNWILIIKYVCLKIHSLISGDA